MDGGAGRRRLRGKPASGRRLHRRLDVPHQEANAATLHEIASFATGSTLAMTFLLPLPLLEEQDRPGLQMAENGARSSGTPFVSFFAPSEVSAVARDAGFRDARYVPISELAGRYFAGRTDGFRPSSGEDFLPAAT